VFSSTLQPTGDGGFTMLGTAYKHRDVTAFSQKHQGEDDMAFIGLEII
jgi:hypothetical protein